MPVTDTLPAEELLQFVERGNLEGDWIVQIHEVSAEVNMHSPRDVGDLIVRSTTLPRVFFLATLPSQVTADVDDAQMRIV